MKSQKRLALECKITKYASHFHKVNNNLQFFHYQNPTMSSPKINFIAKINNFFE